MKKQLFWLVLVVMISGPLTRYILQEKPVEQSEKAETSYKAGSMTYSSGTYEYNMQSSIEMPGNSIGIEIGYGDVNADDAAAGNVDANNEGVYIFQVNGNGKLVMNEKTRLAIERLHALNTPEERNEKLQEFLKILPPDAHHEVISLLDYFEKYTNDVKQITENQDTPGTMEDALKYIQKLHDQRVMTFGGDIAKAFFEKEESTNREMLELVYKEKAYGM